MRISDWSSDVCSSDLPAATALQGLALWIWHAPSAFQAALGSDLIHFAEHATMLAAALLFWWVLARSGDPARPGLGAGALCALVTLVHCGFLGALITFAPTPLRSEEHPSELQS